MKEKSEMTVNESLALITETMNNSRKAILRSCADGWPASHTLLVELQKTMNAL